ncbi:MAG: isoprenylcysteine carboxylmethyltransferase family protein [Clostridia bacterium]|nr:isoprenylcysteine carboxylmethyltransferase family protein [Clostridia bacterium]MBQ2152243.1 isoprenylcysteine carboxylmethyltransferase family protein [Clostridia bacterium]MBQ5439342.1 isoprenylcysteine carboxylmethyltransferase family protein [Clostridia bacterium]
MVFRIISLLIMAMFYGCYFAKIIMLRKEGIRTDHIGENKSGIVKLIEVSMIISACILPVIQIICIIMGTSAFHWSVRTVGALIAFMGMTVFVLSVITMKNNWRVGVSTSEKTELVTKGIYSISRNPAFLGFDLMHIGVLIMFYNIPLFVLTAFSVFLLHMQIVNVEEDHLTAVFGKEYVEYKKSVCRYLGRKIKNDK